MVSPQPRRGLPLGLALVLLLVAAPQAAPSAGADHDPLHVGEPDAGLPGDAPAPRPDLMPGNTHVSGTDETSPFTICVWALNANENGTASSQPFDVVLHVDGFEHGVKRVTEVLQNGFGAEACWDDVQLAAGTHTYHWVVDANDEVDEESETNNVATSRTFVVQETPRPNLVLEWFDVFPRVGHDGQPQVFRAIVRNTGNAPSPATHVNLTDDTGALGEFPVQALQPGARFEVSKTTQPALRPSGAFVAKVRVDPDDAIHEWNETDNEKRLAYEIAPHPLPDLRVENLTLDGPRTLGSTLRLNFTVVNAGDREAPGFLITVLDGTTPILNSSRGGLGVGANTTVRFLLALGPGDHNLTVHVDRHDAIVEHDEADNAAVVRVMIERPEEMPDVPNLIVERLDAAPADPRPNETVTLIAFLRNPSPMRINETQVEFTVNGEPLGTAVAAALEPGRYASVTFSWPVQTEGSYTIRARADAANEVNESDETDNLLARTFVVVEPPPPAPPAPLTPTPPTAGNDTGGTGNATTPPPEGTPTPPTPDAPGATNETAPTLEMVVTLTTTSVPGGAEASAVVSLRNPALTPVGQLTVAFKVNGETLKTVLVNGIAGAGTTPVPSGLLKVPAGTHDLVVEVRGVSGGPVLATGSKSYTVEPGEEGVPGPGAWGAVAAAAVAALALARRDRARLR